MTKKPPTINNRQRAINAGITAPASAHFEFRHRGPGNTRCPDALYNDPIGARQIRAVEMEGPMPLCIDRQIGRPKKQIPEIRHTPRSLRLALMSRRIELPLPLQTLIVHQYGMTIQLQTVIISFIGRKAGDAR